MHIKLAPGRRAATPKPLHSDHIPRPDVVTVYLICDTGTAFSPKAAMMLKKQTKDDPCGFRFRFVHGTLNDTFKDRACPVTSAKELARHKSQVITLEQLGQALRTDVVVAFDKRTFNTLSSSRNVGLCPIRRKPTFNACLLDYSAGYDPDALKSIRKDAPHGPLYGPDTEGLFRRFVARIGPPDNDLLQHIKGTLSSWLKPEQVQPKKPRKERNVLMIANAIQSVSSLKGMLGDRRFQGVDRLSIAEMLRNGKFMTVCLGSQEKPTQRSIEEFDQYDAVFVLSNYDLYCDLLRARVTKGRTKTRIIWSGCDISSDDWEGFGDWLSTRLTPDTLLNELLAAFDDR